MGGISQTVFEQVFSNQQDGKSNWRDITVHTKIDWDFTGKWKKFKGMLVKCPYHSIPDQMLGQRVYIGLADSLKANIDASACGAFFNKSFTDCNVILDKIAQNSG